MKKRIALTALLTMVLSAALTSVASAALGPEEGVFIVSTSDTFKDALEYDTLTEFSKKIDTPTSLTLDESVNVKWSNSDVTGIEINIGGDYLNMSYTPSASLTIAQNVVMDIPDGTNSINKNFMSFYNGNSYDSGVFAHTQAILNVEGTINVGSNAGLSILARRNESEPSDKGSMKVVHSGTINVKAGGELLLGYMEDLDDTGLFVPVDWRESTGVIVLSEGAVVGSFEKGLLIDSGIQCVPSHGYIEVVGAGIAPDPSHLTAGTYKYDQSANAFVKEGGAPIAPPSLPGTTDDGTSTVPGGGGSGGGCSTGVGMIALVAIGLALMERKK